MKAGSHRDLPSGESHRLLGDRDRTAAKLLSLSPTSYRSSYQWPVKTSSSPNASQRQSLFGRCRRNCVGRQGREGGRRGSLPTVFQKPQPWPCSQLGGGLHTAPEYGIAYRRCCRPNSRFHCCCSVPRSGLSRYGEWVEAVRGPQLVMRESERERE